MNSKTLGSKPRRKNPTASAQDRCRVSYHEAGHAVVDALLGCLGPRVSIHRVDGPDGLTYEGLTDNTGPTLHGDVLISLLAGIAAEQHAGLSDPDTASQSTADHEEMARYLFEDLGLDPDEAKGTIQLAIIILRHLMDASWPAVEAVAVVLEASGSLSKARVDAIVPEAIGRDGSAWQEIGLACQTIEHFGEMLAAVAHMKAVRQAFIEDATRYSRT